MIEKSKTIAKERATVQPSISIATITPDEARELLERNTCNRPVRKSRVAQYAASMAANDWLLTGEAITLNGNVLLNGQHRLLACIAADVPFRTVVAQGVATDAMTYMDSGLSRTTGDDLAMRHGMANGRSVAAIARTYLSWTQGLLTDPAKIAATITRRDVEQFALNHAEYCENATRWAQSFRRLAHTPLSGPGAFHVRAFLVADADFCASFFDPLISGADLTVGDPRLALRNWFINKPVPRVIDQLTALTHGWNAYVGGTKRFHIKGRRIGEAMPSMIEA